MPSSHRNGDETEARRTLLRVAQESDGSAMASPGANAPEDDWIEVTGTRIGRVLGPLILLGCAIWLLFHLRAGG